MGLPRSVLIIPLPLARSSWDNVPVTSYGLGVSVFSRLGSPPFAIAGIHPETRMRHRMVFPTTLQPGRGCALWKINVLLDGVIGVCIRTSLYRLRWNRLRWCRISRSWCSRFGRRIRRGSRRGMRGTWRRFRLSNLIRLHHHGRETCHCQCTHQHYSSSLLRGIQGEHAPTSLFLFSEHDRSTNPPLQRRGANSSTWVYAAASTEGLPGDCRCFRFQRK
jgi:hypothetical protein